VNVVRARVVAYDARVHSTNYYDTFIAVAPDCGVVRGTNPRENAKLTVAARTLQSRRRS
jgi:hypothetical protein